MRSTQQVQYRKKILSHNAPEFVPKKQGPKKSSGLSREFLLEKYKPQESDLIPEDVQKLEVIYSKSCLGPVALSRFQMPMREAVTKTQKREELDMKIDPDMPQVEEIESDGEDKVQEEEAMPGDTQKIYFKQSQPETPPEERKIREQSASIASLFPRNDTACDTKILKLFAEEPQKESTESIPSGNKKSGIDLIFGNEGTRNEEDTIAVRAPETKVSTTMNSVFNRLCTEAQEDLKINASASLKAPPGSLPPPPSVDTPFASYAKAHSARTPQERIWYYCDLYGRIQGPFMSKEMDDWNANNFFFDTLKIRIGTEAEFLTLKEMKTHVQQSKRIQTELFGDTLTKIGCAGSDQSMGKALKLEEIEAKKSEDNDFLAKMLSGKPSSMQENKVMDIFEWDGARNREDTEGLKKLLGM